LHAEGNNAGEKYGEGEMTGQNGWLPYPISFLRLVNGSNQIESPGQHKRIAFVMLRLIMSVYLVLAKDYFKKLKQQSAKEV
jgi:hypothetical protein